MFSIRVGSGHVCQEIIKTKFPASITPPLERWSVPSSKLVSPRTASSMGQLQVWGSVRWMSINCACRPTLFGLKQELLNSTIISPVVFGIHIIFYRDNDPIRPTPRTLGNHRRCSIQTTGRRNAQSIGCNWLGSPGWARMDETRLGRARAIQRNKRFVAAYELLFFPSASIAKLFRAIFVSIF